VLFHVSFSLCRRRGVVFVDVLEVCAYFDILWRRGALGARGHVHNDRFAGTFGSQPHRRRFVSFRLQGFLPLHWIHRQVRLKFGAGTFYSRFDVLDDLLNFLDRLNRIAVLSSNQAPRERLASVGRDEVLRRRLPWKTGISSATNKMSGSSSEANFVR
jgi:hypothetical protein